VNAYTELRSRGNNLVAGCFWLVVEISTRLGQNGYGVFGGFVLDLSTVCGWDSWIRAGQLKWVYPSP